jgi:hypothetical protein
MEGTEVLEGAVVEELPELMELMPWRLTLKGQMENQEEMEERAGQVRVVPTLAVEAK